MCTQSDRGVKYSEIWISPLRPPAPRPGSQSLGKPWTAAHWRCRLACPLWFRPPLMTHRSPAPPSCPSRHTMRRSPEEQKRHSHSLLTAGEVHIETTTSLQIIEALFSLNIWKDWRTLLGLIISKARLLKRLQRTQFAQNKSDFCPFVDFCWL